MERKNYLIELATKTQSHITFERVYINAYNELHAKDAALNEKIIATSVVTFRDKYNLHLRNGDEVKVMSIKEVAPEDVKLLNRFLGEPIKAMKTSGQKLVDFVDQMMQNTSEKSDIPRMMLEAPPCQAFSSVKPRGESVIQSLLNSITRLEKLTEEAKSEHGYSDKVKAMIDLGYISPQTAAAMHHRCKSHPAYYGEQE